MIGSSLVRDGAPLVSVIMPVYNAGVYLRLAVESVLRQTYTNWELIVIDDGSTDGCMKTVEDLVDPRIQRVHQPNAGKPAAMNVGLAQARGEFYALLDADDLNYPSRLERQVACLQADTRLAGVLCGYDLILGGRVVAPTFRTKSAHDVEHEIRAGRMPGHDPTAMYRMSLVREFAYSEDLPIVEGLDYVLRVGEKHPLCVLGECLYSYRIHLDSVTKRDPARRNALVQEVIARMRQRRGPAFDAWYAQSAPRPGTSDADNDLVSHFTMSVADLVSAGRRGQRSTQVGGACA